MADHLRTTWQPFNQIERATRKVPPMSLIDEVRARIKALKDEREQKRSELHSIIEAVEKRRDGGDLTEEEATRFTEIRDEIKAIDEQRSQLQKRLDDLVAEAAGRRKADEGRRRFEREDPDEMTIITTHQHATYTANGQHSFFRDAIAQRLGVSPAATERLASHQSEALAAMSEREQRDVGSSAFGGLVVPQYLTELFAEVARASAPFLFRAQDLPLPEEGMTLVVPRGETGTTVAAQAAENTAVSETDADFDNDLSIPVRTFAGQQDISRQALERGRNIDELIFDDLAADYVKKVDVSAIADDGTSGTHKGVLAATGVNSVTYTDAAPTVAALWPKLANGAQLIGSTRFRAADTIFMHPRRWGWINAALDSSDRPLIVPTAQGPHNAFATVGPPQAEGSVGTMQGLDVYLDANIPTNLGAGTDEDRIIIARSRDLLIWTENGLNPRMLRIEGDASGNLTVKLVAYGYSAFTAERFPKAVAIIAGTGLVTPTF